MLFRFLPIGALLFSSQFSVINAASSGQLRVNAVTSGLSVDSATPVRLSLSTGVISS